MLSLLPLVFAPASAVTVTVAHGGYQFSYEMEVGDEVTETWEGILDVHRSKRRRGDLSLRLALTEAGPHQTLTVQIEETTRKGTTTVARPTLVFIPGQTAEFVSGGEVPVHVRSGADTDAEIRFVGYGTRILVGDSAFLPTAWSGHITM